MGTARLLGSGLLALAGLFGAAWAQDGLDTAGMSARMARLAEDSQAVAAAIEAGQRLARDGRNADAEAELREAVARADAMGLPGGDEQGRSRSALAQHLVMQDRPQDAEPLLREILALHRQRGVDPAFDAPHYEALASTLMRQARYAAAGAELATIQAALEKGPAGASAVGLEALQGWKGRVLGLAAQLAAAAGRYPEALARYDQALGILRGRGTPPEILVLIETGRADAALRAKRPDGVLAGLEARRVELARERGTDSPLVRLISLAAAEAALAGGAPRGRIEELIHGAGPFEGDSAFPAAVAGAVYLRGRILLADGRAAEAEARFEEAITFFSQLRLATGAVREDLVAALEAQGKKARAVRAVREAREARRGRP